MRSAPTLTGATANARAALIDLDEFDLSDTFADGA
jgi:hypothetical protein